MPVGDSHRAGTHIIGVRFDGDRQERWGTVESTDTEALFVAPFYAKQLIGKLTHSRQLVVEFTPRSAPPATVFFDTRGFRMHAARVLAACPAIDRPKGQFPIGVEPWSGATEPLIGRDTDTIRVGAAAVKAGRSPPAKALTSS